MMTVSAVVDEWSCPCSCAGPGDQDCARGVGGQVAAYHGRMAFWRRSLPRHPPPVPTPAQALSAAVESYRAAAYRYRRDRDYRRADLTDAIAVALGEVAAALDIGMCA